MSKFHNEHFQIYNRVLGQFSYESFAYLITNYLIFRENRDGIVVLKTLLDVAENHNFSRIEAKKFFNKMKKNKLLLENEGVVCISQELSAEPEEKPHKSLNKLKKLNNSNNSNTAKHTPLASLRGERDIEEEIDWGDWNKDEETEIEWNFEDESINS